MCFSTCINQYSESRLPSTWKGAESSNWKEEGLLRQRVTWQSPTEAGLSSAHPQSQQWRWRHSLLWEVSPLSQGNRINGKTVPKRFPCSSSKELDSWGVGGRWDSREGIGREEMRKCWGEKCVDGQGMQGFLQVTALSLLRRVRKGIYRAPCWYFSST